MRAHENAKMPRKRDDETGEFYEVYEDGQIYDLLKDKRLATSEVAEYLGCHRTTAWSKLKYLEEKGVITSSIVGNTFLWEVDDESQG